MRNSAPITYKGVRYPGAYIEMGGSIGCIRVATGSLLKALEKDGLYSENVPCEVEAVDEQIAYYLTDEEFRLPVAEVKKIIRSAYDDEAPTTHFEEKTIRELKQGEFFRLRKSATDPVWIRGKYVPELKKYSTCKFDDVNHERHLKGSTKVYIGFTY